MNGLVLGRGDETARSGIKRVHSWPPAEIVDCFAFRDPQDRLHFRFRVFQLTRKKGRGKIKQPQSVVVRVRQDAQTVRGEVTASEVVVQPWVNILIGCTKYEPVFDIWFLRKRRRGPCYNPKILKTFRLIFRLNT